MQMCLWCAEKFLGAQQVHLHCQRCSQCVTCTATAVQYESKTHFRFVVPKSPHDLLNDLASEQACYKGEIKMMTMNMHILCVFVDRRAMPGS